MLQVCENEIPLQKWSGGTVQLRTLEGTLVLKFFKIIILLIFAQWLSFR